MTAIPANVVPAFTPLTDRQRRGLDRLGDVVIPGDDALPSFSASGCARSIDEVLPYLSDADRSGLTSLLDACAYLPRASIAAIAGLADRADGAPAAVAPALRMAALGIHGTIQSLYWSNVGEGDVYSVIGYDATVDEAAYERALAADPPMPTPTPDSEAGKAASDGHAASLHRSLLTPAEAMQTARSGARSLRDHSLAERLALLRRLRELILERFELIAEIVRGETRKSISDIVYSEIFGALDAIAWCEANAASALADEKVPTPLTLIGRSSRIWFEPRGTVLVITPWNYPFYQAIVPIALAFAAGNAVVVKPSEHTPLLDPETRRGIVETLLEDAGFAPAWVQVVHGDGATGEALIAAHPDQIMFTGSTRTGRAIAGQAAQLLIPLELELGGKDPMIVFEDADLDRAVAGAVFGALTANGQSCTSVERLYVHAAIHDEFVRRLVAAVGDLTQAVSPSPDIDLGAMTVDFQVETVARQLADAVARGAVVHTGGHWDGQDRLIPPTVVTKVTDDALLATEETFGPVIPVFAFTSEAEVIARANDSAYGLTASVWSADRARAERVARALRCGGVSINNVMATEATPALPFGGLGESGYGRYKGVAGLRTFTNAKSVLLDKDGPTIEANWYPYTAEKYRRFTAMMRAYFTDSPTRLAKFAAAGRALEKYAAKARH